MPRVDKVNENLTVLRTSLPLCSDAYLLYAYMHADKNAKVAEFGAGGGIISLLALAAGKFSHIDGYEIQEHLVKIAEENAKANKLNGKFDVVCGDVREIPPKNRYDVIFFNPPYYPENSGKTSDNDERKKSFCEIHGGIADFCKAAQKHLNFGGLVYTVYPASRISAAFSAFENAGMAPKFATFVYPTLSHEATVALICAKYGGNVGMKITRPLIIYKKENTSSPSDYTDDMKYIYENGDFNEFYKKFR